MTLYGGDPRAARASTTSVERLDLGTGDLAPPTAAARAEPGTHLPKRLSHWVVDTLRSVSWIGPAPIAWLEDQALGLRDSYRRFVYSSGSKGTDTKIASADPPPPPVLDTSQASVEEAHWPPAPDTDDVAVGRAGRGEWAIPDVPWLRVVPGVASDAPSPFYRTYVRPDAERPYVKVLLVAMDLRQLDLDMEAGVEDPEPLTGPPGSGRIPRDPAVYRRVAAAFNGAFKTEHGHYGMMVHRRVLLPPLPGSASVVVLDDGRVGFGTWGQDRKVGGIAGVPDDQIASFRQNLEPLLDQGKFNPSGRNLWGFTLPGKGAQTERSGMCVTTSGHLIYAWGDDVSAPTLAKALSMASCDYAIHLDMNPYHTGFLFTAIDDLGTRKYKSQLLTPGMSIPVDRYIQYAPKDFFYVMVHDPTPKPMEVDAASPWTADGGTQPPPHWMPGLWKAHSTVRVDRPRSSTWSPSARHGASAPERRKLRPRGPRASSRATPPVASCSRRRWASPRRSTRAASPPVAASPSRCTAGRSRAPVSPPLRAAGRAVARRTPPSPVATTSSSCPWSSTTATPSRRPRPLEPRRAAVRAGHHLGRPRPHRARQLQRLRAARRGPAPRRLRPRRGARTRRPHHRDHRPRGHRRPPPRSLRRERPVRPGRPPAPSRLPLRPLQSGGPPRSEEVNHAASALARCSIVRRSRPMARAWSCDTRGSLTPRRPAMVLKATPSK